LQQDPFFQINFEEAQYVYDYLKASINEIVVEGDTLFFNYEYGKNRVRRISIQLLREAIDPVEFAHLKTQKMTEHFTAQLFQKDIEIRELQQKYEEIAETLF
jgi:transcriptional accessory protein Tex/SPT6